ncbi:MULTISPECIES: nucleoside recognition domain-containing protein [unclassified Sedimentibacter]|uniref:nucleoside recognition domain-containing protein n=1 Tax=unclassified Sedimentibacter TaxID=2649220 RepID=UPI0027E202FB|nr:nucleoside recognition domain-containing protein [Sedimentibacter sp. MB35-C1]WMJ76793.1 nucleoside recognition domain-containing protein [Sedimentibacter sp. MB35-C1]
METVLEILLNLTLFIWSIAKVLIPLMIIIEIFKDTKMIDKISHMIKPVTNFFTISEDSGISLVFGLIFGLTIGAGAVIQSVKDYNIDKRSVFLVTMFLSMCHAVFEDSMIMGAAGANPFAVLAARILSAIFVTFILSRFVKKDIPLNDIQKDGSY